jgi:hypothetical protein
MSAASAAQKSSISDGVVDGPVEIRITARAVSGDRPMLSGTRVWSFFFEEQAAPAEMQIPRLSAILTTTSAGRGGNPAERM